MTVSSRTADLRTQPDDRKMVRFGDVVRDVKESERNWKDAGLERYVGLEHIEPHNLHLSEWGWLEDDEVSFTKRFRAGHVLFAKRRAYQRKVAIAEFDGICSSDILTFAAVETKLLPRLLPFIVQSDGFFDHALDTSSGSLSPRTRWSQLKDFEFVLPSLKEQQKIADLFVTHDEATVHVRCALQEISNLKRMLLTKLTIQGLSKCKLKKSKLGRIPDHWSLSTVDDVTSVCQYGLSIPLHEEGQYPILRMMNYDDGVIVANTLKYVDLDNSTFADFRLEPDDILFNRTNSADLVGKVGIYRLDGDFVFASYLVRLRADADKILPAFLNYYLNSELGQRRILAYATPGVSQTNVSAGNLKKVRVPVPPLEEQERILEVLDDVSERKRELENYLRRLSQLKAALMNRFINSSSGEVE